MGGRILVVDGISINRIILKTKLSAAHFRVAIAPSVGDAVQAARTQMPNLIFLALNIGADATKAICKNLKSHPDTSHIPILCFAEMPLDCPEVDLLEAGASAIMVNPVPDTVLLSKARAMIRTSRLLKDIRDREHYVEEISVPRRLTKRPATVGCVSRNYEAADKLRTQLIGDFAGIVDVLDHSEILFSGPSSSAYDVLVIGSHNRDTGATLRLLSEMCSTRSAYIFGLVVILPGAKRSEIARAYDRGADHVFTEMPEPEVISLLIQRLSDNRQKDDYLNVCIQDGLRMATTDPLTGVRNRRYAVSKLDKIASEARQTKSSFALLILDIDHFKQINDKHGHLAGDVVLKKIAQTLKDTLRDIDLLARIGGEEFLIALPCSDEKLAVRTANKLREKIESLRFDGDGQFNVTMSVGATLSYGDGPINDIMHAADKALYAAKSDGRNTVNLSLVAA